VNVTSAELQNDDDDSKCQKKKKKKKILDRRCWKVDKKPVFGVLGPERPAPPPFVDHESWSGVATPGSARRTEHGGVAAAALRRRRGGATAFIFTVPDLCAAHNLHLKDACADYMAPNRFAPRGCGDEPFSSRFSDHFPLPLAIPQRHMRTSHFPKSSLFFRYLTA